MKTSVFTLCVHFATLIAMPAADYSTIGPHVEKIIRQEMKEWGIGGISVALVDDQQTIFSAGYGEANKDSLFRCGSISKLFNAVAVMQQVEAGKLDLDAPLQTYGDGLLPVNPYPDSPPVTLRQILCHRSGLPREAPVGGYFDPAQPSLAATVASMAGTVLATRPGEKTRYSNVAPSIAGNLVEIVSVQPYEVYQHAHVLGPLGMSNSAWTLARTRQPIIVSHMRVADGHGGWTRREAPLFDLGTIPAGNLFSSAEDLARFVSALAAGGRGVLKPQTLAEMWKPQLTKEETGFGLGFMIGKYRSHRTISHNGAVYGHSASLVLLPEVKVGVVLLGNEDVANGRIQHISNAALSLLLEAKLGEHPPENPVAPPLDGAALAYYMGDYESQSFWARLEVRDARLTGEISGQPVKFTPSGPMQFTADSRIDGGTPVKFQQDPAGKVNGFTMGIQQFHREPADPKPLPKEWNAVTGIYGPDFIPLVVHERHGHLYAMTENMVDYRLTPVNRNVCALPPGMYVDEHAVFLTNRRGVVHAVNFANMILPRR